MRAVIIRNRKRMQLNNSNIIHTMAADHRSNNNDMLILLGHHPAAGEDRLVVDPRRMTRMAVLLVMSHPVLP